MKTSRFFFLAACALLASSAFAEALSSQPSALSSAVPAASWQQALIPILTPLIVAGVKLIVPRIPRVWLPILAPVLGAALDYVAHLATGSSLNPLAGLALGAAGVGLREVVDQVKRSMPPAQIAPLFFLLLAPCALLLSSGCTSLTKQIDAALPEGRATKVTATITGKFSSTQVDASNFEKTREKVSADRMHFRHSNAWVPLIEGEVEGYERVRQPAETTPPESK